jgi:membrane associated rhomboid family serine protease
METNDITFQKKRFFASLYLPGFFIFILFMVKILETLFDLNLTRLGVYPRTAEGLIGILTSPLVHGSWKHLIDNVVPLLILFWALNYFYNQISIKVFGIIYILTGIFVWLFGRGDAYHIGASGVVYGLLAFHLLSGVIRRNVHLLAMTLLVTFVYGYLVWGVFPYKEEISWESHMSGAIIGLFLAVIYRNQGPPPDPEYNDEDQIIDEEFSDQTEEQELFRNVNNVE